MTNTNTFIPVETFWTFLSWSMSSLSELVDFTDLVSEGRLDVNANTKSGMLAVKARKAAMENGIYNLDSIDGNFRKSVDVALSLSTVLFAMLMFPVGL